jgi:hypothetical protein
MSQDKVSVYRSLLQRSFKDTVRVARTVPESNRCLQLEDGRVQPTWLVGHLANTVNVVVHSWMFEGVSLLPKGWGRMFAPDFAGGTPVTCNPEDYPPFEDVVSHYAQITSQVLEDLQALMDEDLPKPLKGNVPEPLREHFPTNDAALTMMVLHDNYHRGQLGLLAKLAGSYRT